MSEEQSYLGGGGRQVGGGAVRSEKSKAMNQREDRGAARNFDWKCNLCPVFFVCVCVRSVM